MSRSLLELHPDVEPLARQLLKDCGTSEIPLTVVFTHRTLREQAGLWEIGRRGVPGERKVTWVEFSWHNIEIDGVPAARAIDVCPTALLREKWWAPGSSLWERVGCLGEELGFTWGGRWKRKRDSTHFQLDDGMSLAWHKRKQTQTGCSVSVITT